MFPDEDIKKNYENNKIEKSLLFQNLTDTDSTSVFCIFVCKLLYYIDEEKARDAIFDVLIKSKILRLDLSDNFWERFGVQTKNLKKQVG